MDEQKSNCEENDSEPTGVCVCVCACVRTFACVCGHFSLELFLNTFPADDGAPAKQSLKSGEESETIPLEDDKSGATPAMSSTLV